MELTAEDLKRAIEVGKELQIRLEGMGVEYQRARYSRNYGDFHDWKVSDDGTGINAIFETYSCGDTDHHYYKFLFGDIASPDPMARAKAAGEADKIAAVKEAEEKAVREKREEELEKARRAKAREKDERETYERLKKKYEGGA